MNSDNISDYKIYDGNGKPFDGSRRYFNRYQSTLRHDLEVRTIKPCKYKTCGGIVNYRLVAYCSFEYYGEDGRITRNSGRFEGEYIAKNIYGFPQLIPVDEGITLDFKYCQTGAYREAVLGLWKKDNPEALKAAEDAEAEERRRIRAALGGTVSLSKELFGELQKVVTELQYMAIAIEQGKATPFGADVVRKYSQRLNAIVKGAR